jgi:hypothetical protein
VVGLLEVDGDLAVAATNLGGFEGVGAAAEHLGRGGDDRVCGGDGGLIGGRIDAQLHARPEHVARGAGIRVHHRYLPGATETRGDGCLDTGLRGGETSRSRLQGIEAGIQEGNLEFCVLRRLDHCLRRRRKPRRRHGDEQAEQGSSEEFLHENILL